MSKTTPCCSKVMMGIKKGPWTPEEDEILANFVRKEGEGRWRTLPKRAGLQRCGKSCRLRWMNYLRPSVKRGKIALDEEDLILRLHRLLGNRWALIAGRIPGRTDNEIKNYWNTHISKKLIRQGIDPRTHKPLITNYTNNTTNTNTKTTTTTTITTSNYGFLSDSQEKVEHHDQSNVTSSNPIPTPQPLTGLNPISPAPEIGSSSSTHQTNFEVPIISAGRMMEYQNEEGHVVDKGNDHGGSDGVNEEEDTFLLFLNSLVDDCDEVMSSTAQPLRAAADTMFPPPLCTSTSFAQPFGLADWEAEFSDVLNGQYGSPSM